MLRVHGTPAGGHFTGGDSFTGRRRQLPSARRKTTIPSGDDNLKNKGDEDFVGGTVGTTTCLQGTGPDESAQRHALGHTHMV